MINVGKMSRWLPESAAGGGSCNAFSGAYNLGTGRPHSVREVIGTVERVTGLNVPWTVGPRLRRFWSEVRDQVVGYEARARLELACPIVQPARASLELRGRAPR